MLYECPYNGCKLSFKYKINLNSHKLTHIYNDLISCNNENCDFKTLHRSSFNKHKYRCIYK